MIFNFVQTNSCHVSLCYQMTRVEHAYYVHNKSWSKTPLSTLFNDNSFYFLS